MKLAAIHAVGDEVDTLERNAETDRLLACLVADRDAGTDPSMKKAEDAPDNAAAHGFFYAHGSGTRQFEHHRPAQHLAQRHGERGVKTILMHMPDVEFSAVAQQKAGERKQAGDGVAVTTIRAGQPPHLVAVDAFHRRPSMVTALGDDDDAHPCLGQGRRQAFRRHAHSRRRGGGTGG